MLLFSCQKFFMLVVLRVKDVPPFLRGNRFLRPIRPFYLKGGICILHCRIMRTLLILLTAISISFPHEGWSQLLGGDNTYNFLELPITPQLSSLGGVNVSNRTNDIGLTISNPSLLRGDMSGQLHASFNLMYAGIKNLALVGGYTVQKWKTNFAVGISYVDYGNMDATDPSGNITGNFYANDVLVKVSASRQYEERWHYGFSINFIQSNYAQYSSSALALDAGVTYYDSLRLMQVSLALKNMGAQLKSFVPGTPEELPFDIQLGISKRLKKAPIQFSATAHHLHQFNLVYNDTAGVADGGQAGNTSAFNKIFQHFVFAVQLYVDDKIEITAGYNILRRNELRIENTANGLTGFSMGLGYTSKKLHLRYARSWYQNNTAYNQFGLNFTVF